MSTWQILGRFRAAPPPPDWPQQLAERLGQRPRRIGRWAELALYGALHCLADAGEATLPVSARLSVSSVHGPDLALRTSLAEARDALPLPIGFLQSQPSQLLPTLASALQWRGDARCLATRCPLDALATALEEGGSDLLLGWVAEDGDGETGWLRLCANATLQAATAAAGFAELWRPEVQCLAVHRRPGTAALLVG